MVISWSEINPARHHGFVRRRLANGHGRATAQYLLKMRAMERTAMNDDRDTGRQVRRQVAEELYQRFHAAGRCADDDHVSRNAFRIDHGESARDSSPSWSRSGDAVSSITVRMRAAWARTCLS